MLHPVQLLLHAIQIRLIAQNLSRPDLDRDRAIPALTLTPMQTEGRIYEYLHVVTDPVISWLRNVGTQDLNLLQLWARGGLFRR